MHEYDVKSHILTDISAEQLANNNNNNNYCNNNNNNNYCNNNHYLTL